MDAITQGVPPLAHPPQPPRRVIQPSEVEGPQDFFECKTLRCSLFARDCIQRQARSAIATQVNIHRGQAAYFPSCTLERCPDAGTIRTRLGGAEFIRAHERMRGSPWIRPWRRGFVKRKR